MTSRARLLVLLISVPLLLLVVVGARPEPHDAADRHSVSAPACVRRRGVARDEQLRRAGRGRQDHERRDARPRGRPRSRLRVADGGGRHETRQGRPAEGLDRRRADASVLPARHLRARRLARRPRRPSHRRFHSRHRRQADARDVGVRRHGSAARGAGHQGEAGRDSRQCRRTAHGRDHAGRGVRRDGVGQDRQARALASCASPASTIGRQPI